MPLNMRFRHQLSVVYSAGILLLTLVANIVVLNVSVQAMRNRSVDEGIRLTEAFADQSRLSLLYASAENADEATDIFMNFPSVQGVQIVDADFNTLFHQGLVEDTGIQPEALPQRSALYAENNDAWYFIAPVLTGGAQPENSLILEQQAQSTPQVIGYVTMNHSKTALKRMIADILLYNIVISTVLAAALLVLLLYITHRLINPIYQLANTMRLAKSGKRNLRAVGQGPRDIVEMQSAFNKMMVTLEQREDDLKAVRDEAFKSAKMKAEFAANVSHELRTPMNGVLGMLELLSEFDFTEKQREYVDIAKNSAVSLLGLIDDVLDFSKNDVGKTQIEKREFDLDEALSEIVMLLGTQAQQKQINLVYVLQPQVPLKIWGDNLRLRQILVNLVGNALKFTREGSISINVACVSRADNHLVLRFAVRDTGIGITAEQKKQIFDAFSQADGTTTRRFGGTGLGLAISRQLVQLMGGELNVDSKPGKGSTFWFTLPLECNVAAAAESPESGMAGKRILLVDNCQAVLDSLTGFLRAQGTRHTTATCLTAAQESMAKAAAEPFDLVVVDEQLDGDKGRLLAKEVCDSGDDGHPRVLLMVNRAIHGQTDLCFDHLTKPLIRSRFLNALKPGSKTQTQPALPSPSAPELEGVLADKRILLVEDNVTNQKVALGLMALLGCHVDVVENGRECLTRLASQRYNLILMDCHMPEMDGFEATRRIRSNEPDGSRVPIVAMTAIMADKIDSCFEAGMDDYLPKPLTRAALNEKLLRWLEPAEQQCDEKMCDEPERDEPEPDQSEPDGSKPDEASSAQRASSTPEIDENTLVSLKEQLGSQWDTIVASFEQSLPTQLDSLITAIDEQNSENVRSAAHTIAGVALNFGAQGLVNASRRLESDANQGRLSNARQHYQIIKQKCDAVRAHLVQS